MGHIDKGDLHGLLDALEFVLHILAQLQVQGAQGLVQQQDLGPVHQGPGDGHPLLLAAGQGGDVPLFKAPQVHDLQHLHDPVVDLFLGQLHLFALGVRLGDAQAKGDVLIHVEVGEQGVFLKDRIDGPLVGRDRIHPHAVEQHIARGGRLKTTDDAQGGGLAASTGAKQREEFLIIDIQVDVIKHDLVVESHGTVVQADQLFGHVSSPISKIIVSSSLVSSLRPFLLNRASGR